MKIRDLIGPLSAIVLPFVMFEYLKTHPTIDLPFIVPSGHFYIVSSVAVLATLVAIAVGIAGNRVRNIKVTFLSLSFVSMAEIFTLHGLATPNFIIHTSHLPEVAAQSSTLLASFWLWMSSLSSDSAVMIRLSRLNGRLIPAWTLVIGLAAIVALIRPHLLDLLPLDRHPLNWAMTGLVVFLSSITLFRYYQSYRYSRFPLQKSIIYSCCWLMVAQYIMVVGESWRMSWWIYHFLLLASMIVMLAGLIKQYAAKKSLTMAIKSLFTNDPMERVTSCLSPSIQALISATEEKDTYTAGHNLRVTMYAIQLAEELRLAPEQLRALSHGSIIHDIGKIHIPDAILNKQGQLTGEERAVIELHPVKGYEMCRTLGFMKEELDIIRSHHEKWDGTGYPDRLKGEDIPMLARIVAVADVYDALTSNRAYRRAWTHDEAVQWLIAHQGTHFDPECLQAWVRVCKRNPQVYPYPSNVIGSPVQASTI